MNSTFLKISLNIDILFSFPNTGQCLKAKCPPLKKQQQIYKYIWGKKNMQKEYSFEFWYKNNIFIKNKTFKNITFKNI